MVALPIGSTQYVGSSVSSLRAPDEYDSSPTLGYRMMRFTQPRANYYNSQFEARISLGYFALHKLLNSDIIFSNEIDRVLLFIDV